MESFQPDATHPVASSSIAAIGYSRVSRVLEVHFVRGTRYRYFDVPDGIVGSLLAASSKGSFFNERVRGQFRYERV